MKTVLGIGNALVDVLIRLKDDSILQKFELEKGSMTLVDREKMNAILSFASTLDLKESPQKSSGGSVANTIHGLAQLGAPAGYIGKINTDEYGNFFRSYMEQNNIKGNFYNGTEDTGKSIVLISSDSERTFATYLGAAIQLDASDLKLDSFKGYDYFHLEGYLAQNHDLVLQAMKLAHEAGCRISIDLASFNIVEENLEFLNSVSKKYVDIIFANEEEAKAYTGYSDPVDALKKIAENCEIAIVKTGQDGSLIKKSGVVHEIEAIKADAMDTTGAGDLYAAGFFFGLVNGQEMPVCGKIGAITAGHIVEVVGAKMEESKWQKVRQLVSEIVV